MKIKLLLILFLLSFFGFSQTYNIGTENGNTINTCSGTFVDSGGTGADYSSSENLTVTFCPTVAGQAIELNFSTFSIESCCDSMIIYDGNSNAAPILGTFNATSPGIITGTTINATGCLTIEFTSDFSITDIGWEAAISCAAPVAPPILMQNGSTTTCSGTFMDSGGGSNYSANEDLTYTICPSTPGQAIQLDFSQFSTNSEDYMVIYDSNGVDFAEVLGTYNGTSVTVPFTVTATTNNSSGCLTITFNSGSSFFQDVGWTSTISCVAPASPPACQGTSSGSSTAGCPIVIAGGIGLGDVDPPGVSCGTGCTDIEATYLDLGDTTSYRVESIAYAPPYQFDCLKVPVSVNVDDVWSPPVNLPFDFCFYGTNYNQCLIGSNGVVTFDMTNNTPGGFSDWSFASNLPDTLGDLFGNSIFGAYHDIDPSIGGDIGYELITLDTGCRALIVAWHDVPMFSCNASLYTGMIVLYENTNVIEVYLEEKNVCASWNDGNAVVGLQNTGGTLSTVAPGRNGLDANWTTTNEAWRFVPDGASITSIAWYEGPTATGPVLGTSDVLNVCPSTDTTYTAEITYTLCDGSTITDTDTTFVTTTCAPPSVTLDFDGSDDYVDAASFMGGFTGASQLAWVHLDTNFGAGGGSVTGNANTAVGGVNPGNATGAILAAGTVANNTNSLRIRNTAPNTTLTLDHTVPLGTNITISIARDNNQGNVTITDGTANMNFSAGPNDVLQHITFTTGQATNTLTISRNGGATWIDGVEYSYTTTGSSGMVMGQPNDKLFIDSSRNLNATIVTNTGTFTATSTSTITTELWTHVASVYDGASLRLYINGILEANVAVTGTALDVDSNSYSVGRDAEFDDKYFNGFIQEVRVYDVALTLNQLREQVYQQVEDNGGNVGGVSVPKAIDGGSLNWNDLVLYLKLDNSAGATTTDDSNSGVTATLNNMTTTQSLTAPIPYVANTSGAWTTVGTWQNGTSWDITTLPNRDWAIVQISNSAIVTTVDTHTHLGLIVDSGAELEVNNDQGLFNTSYLELDGVLDLNGESQLVQSTTSDLAVSSAGRLERDQQGRGDIFSYNNWSAPVSTISTVANNLGYSPNTVMMDGTNPSSPQPITYVTGFDGAPTTPITISNYWFWIYEDQPDDYNNWVQNFETGALAAGQGYTMKGPGTGGTTNTQNYVFSGKPNNASIDHAIGATNLSLLGNPYPSALDADQFITDNIGVINANGDVIGAGITTGALYFWEHFPTNSSHVLSAYEGGYATYNLTGATMAIPDPDVSANGTGTKLPQRYIPVGQAFFVQGGAGGNINFNNGQRAFVTESSGGSIFMFDGGGNTTQSDEPSPQVSEPNPEIDRIYFRFTTPEGPQRQLLLGVKEGTSLAPDFGYDARLLEKNPTDASWNIGDLPYVIQAIGSIEEDLELPLHIVSDTGGNVSLAIEVLQGIDEGLEIYLLDKELNTYQDLRTSAASFTITAGEHLDRYFVVFKNTETSEDPQPDTVADNLVVYHHNGQIIIENPTAFDAQDIQVYNLLGQLVCSPSKNYNQVNQINIPEQLSDGAYIIMFKYNNHKKITKKLLVEN